MVQDGIVHVFDIIRYPKPSRGGEKLALAVAGYGLARVVKVSLRQPAARSQSEPHQKAWE